MGFKDLQETLDLMGFITAKRFYPALENKAQAWQQDFLFISQPGRVGNIFIVAHHFVPH